MVQLQKKFKEQDAQSKEKLLRTFQFKNKEATVIINDVNYWTFGELKEDIPEKYYSNDPSVSMDYQIKKMIRHYDNFPDDSYIGFLHPWFGTGVLASSFGTPIVFNPKADPAVDLSTINSIEEVKKLEIPVPGEDGIMPMVVKAIEHYKSNCDLVVGVTDCQGPLTTALSIVGYDKFCYWMSDYPNEIHELMEKVTEALIQWVKFQKKLTDTPLNGESYPLGVKMADGYGGAWISDDDAVIIGTEQYKEFVVPYNSKFLKAFDGGCIHYCGTATQHIDNYLNTEGLTCINNFNLDNLGEAAKIRNALVKKGILYMACDFIPSDARLETYYRDLFAAMGNQEGLVVAAYVAPAIELDKGDYQPSHRDQLNLAKKVNREIKKHLGH